MGYSHIEDPVHAYDVYCDDMERAYQELIEGKRCIDCDNCIAPNDYLDNPSRLGYCKDCEEFVCLDDPVECDSFKRF